MAFDSLHRLVGRDRHEAIRQSSLYLRGVALHAAEAGALRSHINEDLTI
jgi:hypothetical protein